MSNPATELVLWADSPRFTEKLSELSPSHAQMIRVLLESHMAAQKNWIASAVESNDNERAKRLVKELRQHEEVFVIINGALLRHEGVI